MGMIQRCHGNGKIIEVAMGKGKQPMFDPQQQAYMNAIKKKLSPNAEMLCGRMDMTDALRAGISPENAALLFNQAADMNISAENALIMHSIIKSFK